MDDKYKQRKICPTFEHKWIALKASGPVGLYECARCGVILTVVPEIKRVQDD